MHTYRRLLPIYIHPAHGPISSMTLDIDKVEIALSKVPEAHASDTVAVNAIAAQIRAQFKEIVPDDEQGKRQLALIMSRWHYVQHFPGIVLRLSGSIKGLTATGDLPKELGEVTAALEKERQAHQQERQTRETLQLRLSSLESEQKRLKTLYQRTNAEATEQHKQLRQALDDARSERQAARLAREEADQARREVGQYKLHLEQLQQEHQACSSQDQYSQELAELRHKTRHQQETEHHLRDTLANREQEITALLAQLQTLTDEAFAVEDATDPDNLYEL
jgi:hypothetical protein